MPSDFRALAVLLLSSSAAAQLTSIAPFAGNYSEGFEGVAVVNSACLPQRIFTNHGDLCTPGGTGCLTTSNWTLFCQVTPHSGALFFGSTSTAAEITFDQPAYRFGGWFATNSGAADANFKFFDAGGNLLATLVGSVPADCAWHWLGVDVGLGTPIKRIVCTSNASFGGGFIEMDDLEFDSSPFTTPSPTAYCTAGTSSNGCVPSISANANPSITLAHACDISVSNLEGQRTAIVFYGINQSGFSPHPWATGSNSFLCVKSPIQRTGVHNTAGTAALCNGSILFDWNAYQSTHPSALGNPFGAGQKVYAQCWYRDPPAPKTTNLSNALELTCVP
jgi:hypothetical protein